MFRSILAAARRNALAALALTLAILAVAGGAYAALRLPVNSVSTRQIVSHSITPNKLSYGPKTFGGYSAHSAIVNANGTIAGGSNGAVNFAGSPSTVYAIQWGTGRAVQRIAHCAPEVTVQGAPASSGALVPGGYATAIVDHGDNVIVRTYNAAGLQVPEPFYLTVTC
jgi:hypothetical protein